MKLPELLAHGVRVAVRRPVLVVAITATLALIGGLLALRLEPSAGTDTVVSKGSASSQATDRMHERFGEEPILVLVNERLSKLLMTSDLQRIIGLEGCIAGRAPDDAELKGGPAGPCGQLRA